MKGIFQIFLLISLFILSSCSSSILDEKIDPSTLFEMAAKIRNEIPNLESAKNNVLSSLETINKGREAFQSISAKDVVNDEKFNMYKEQLFNYFLSRGTTYKQLFDEVEIMNAFDERFGEQIRNVNQRIDVYCKERQFDVDEKERQVVRTIAELSKAINVNIISINKSRYFQHESVDVLAQINNTTNIPIEAIDFNLYISKGGTIIAKLPIHMDDRFVSNKMKKFSYTKEGQPAIFNALKNLDIYSITLKEEVYKINHDGTIKDAYAIMKGIKNHQYKSAEVLKGECPYLSTNDNLYKEIENLMQQKNVELAEATPCLTKIEYIKESLQTES